MADPDPVLTASVFCNRRIDALMRDAIAPLRRELVASAPESTLTLFRYGKGGEHLKVWIYGSDRSAEVARPLFAKLCEPFLASELADPRPGDSWISKAGLPPIDAEDESATDHANKSWMFTHYRRSPVLLGCELYTKDDRHVGLYVQAQAAASHLILERLAPYADTPEFFKARQSTFLNLLVAGFAGVQFTPAELVSYLTFHRDWMIRTVARIAGPGKSPETIVADFEARARTQHSAVVGLIGHLEQACLGQILDQDPLLLAWRDAVRKLYEYATTYRGRAEYDQDPFTGDFAFLPLFKVLHGAGNQFGLRLSHEGLLHHLLLAATRLFTDNEVAAEAVAGG